jgi:hypothetical protein
VNVRVFGLPETLNPHILRAVDAESCQSPGRPAKP